MTLHLLASAEGISRNSSLDAYVNLIVDLRDSTDDPVLPACGAHLARYSQVAQQLQTCGILCQSGMNIQGSYLIKVNTCIAIRLSVQIR